ncbi:hypothetical protein KLI87_06505 [Actinomadura sp. NEAU-AAG7]|nr:hypothetical protein [Actinomadura sp. NEAU-AAG7]
MGTGYSCSDLAEYVKDEDVLSEMFWEGLQRSFAEHEAYARCPLYIAGQSYGGSTCRTSPRRSTRRTGRTRAGTSTSRASPSATAGSNPSCR